jgi:hypothetical protein
MHLYRVGDRPKILRQEAPKTAAVYFGFRFQERGNGRPPQRYAAVRRDLILER